MIMPSWELAGCIIFFQAAQAIVSGATIAMLLWYANRTSARRERARCDPA